MILFQSTLLQEERPISDFAISTNVEISIHAPTRGATLYLFCTCSKRLLFQSTLLQEERHVKVLVDDLAVNFNPRSYKRSDVAYVKNISNYLISIHAPTRGATIISFHMLYLLIISIHAPTRGATVTYTRFIP